jgi:hypothetical protein
MGYRIRMAPEVAWYTEAIRQSGTRYRRDRGRTG